MNQAPRCTHKITPLNLCLMGSPKIEQKRAMLQFWLDKEPKASWEILLVPGTFYQQLDSYLAKLHKLHKQQKPRL